MLVFTLTVAKVAEVAEFSGGTYMFEFGIAGSRSIN